MAETYTVQRSRLIEAPAETVYAALVDFRRWEQWSPWEQLDPAMARAYSGPAQGVGSVTAWSGNRKAGTGRMEILRAEFPREVEIALDFEKPFKSRNVTAFELREQETGTLVTWRMTGPQPVLMKLLGRWVSMEKLLGEDFEKGLARLAAETENQPAP